MMADFRSFVENAGIQGGVLMEGHLPIRLRRLRAEGGRGNDHRYESVAPARPLFWVDLALAHRRRQPALGGHDSHLDKAHRRVLGVALLRVLHPRAERAG